MSLSHIHVPLPLFFLSPHLSKNKNKNKNKKPKKTSTNFLKILKKKMSLNNEGKIKTFSDKIKLNVFMASKFTAQKMPKYVF